MGANTCPVCSAPIPTANINVAEGAALCASCGKVSKLSALVQNSPPIDELLEKTPGGCAILDQGNEVLIRASMRSVAVAGFFLFFALFWNSILSVFLVIAIAGLYANLVGPLPDWMPGPAQAGNSNSMGETLFLCLFLIPFIIVGIVTAFIALLGLFGSVRVRLRGEEGSVWTGLGPIGWTRRFNAGAVRSVSIRKTSFQVNHQHKPAICIEADRPVKFGSMLREDRLHWMRAALHTLLVAPDANQRERLMRSTFKPREYRRV